MMLWSIAPAHDRVDVDGLRLRERVVALQPGQLDDLLDEPGQPGALGLHPPGEPDHRLRVVGGLLDRLGEQVQRADRGLQLVGDVGDEVAADRLDAPLAGAVLDERQHQPAAQRGHPGGDVQRRDRPAARHHQLGLADLPVAAHLPDQVGELLDRHLVAADQAEGVRRRGGLEDLVLLVDDQGAGAQHGEHGGDARGYGGLLDLRALVHLRLADPPREDDAGAQDRAEQREEQRLRRLVHALDRTAPRRRVFVQQRRS